MSLSLFASEISTMELLNFLQLKNAACSRGKIVRSAFLRCSWIGEKVLRLVKRKGVGRKIVAGVENLGINTVERAQQDLQNQQENRFFHGVMVNCISEPKINKYSKRDSFGKQFIFLLKIFRLSRSIIAIVPARYASTRFPGKPLAEIMGKSMIVRVVEQVKKSQLVDRIIVATDDERIFNHVSPFCEVKMTASELASGTDRCASVLKTLGEPLSERIVVNVQGDEPFIQPEQIDLLVQFMLDNSICDIGTLIKKIDQPEDVFNPNIVKVVRSLENTALYFSRNPIPFVRGVEQKEWLGQTSFFKHIGMYAFRASVLMDLAELPVSSLEKAESLEQLRWLENGYSIGVAETELETRGIDTPEDLASLTK